MATAQRTAARPRRQRRAGEELRDAILAAASEVFFEAGYQGASIEAVIERVGGSKRAIYSHFGGKKELFAALVTEASNRALAALSPEEVVGHDLESTLLAFGRRVIDAVMSPTTLALYRAIVAEGVRFPDLAHIFFERGPGRAAYAPGGRAGGDSGREARSRSRTASAPPSTSSACSVMTSICKSSWACVPRPTPPRSRSRSGRRFTSSSTDAGRENAARPRQEQKEGARWRRRRTPGPSSRI